MGIDATTVTALWEEEQTSVSPVNFATDDWSTIVASVQSGNHPYQAGNTKTIEMDVDGNGEKETYTIRVANTTKCSEEWMQDEEKSKTACGFVLEFVDIITNVKMNSTNTNAGGWPASEMRTYLKDSILPMIQEEIGNGIIDTYVISSHGKDDNTGTIGENKNFASTDKLYLLSPEEVYGTSFTNSNDLSRGTSRQLEYYEDKEVTTSKYGDAVKSYQGSASYWWWLRSANSNYDIFFYDVDNDGNWNYYNAYSNFGVSPAFRLAD